MGLLDNLKNQANLDKLKEQAMKTASQLVDKAQEKLSEMQANEEEEEPKTRPRTAEPSKRKQAASSQEERPVYEKRDGKPAYQSQPVKSAYQSQPETPSYPQPQNQMFSKELEALIQAALEDGVLEDYEKAALVRRAQAEGVDFAELEIFINSILHRRKKEQARREDERQEAIDQKKKEAFGRVCPNCGKQVPTMTLKCDCGYEFTANKQVSSVQLLANKIETITNENKEGKDNNENERIESRRVERICDTISVFPVPNTKEDIIEFLAMAAPNSKTKGGIWGTMGGRILLLTCLIVIAIVLELIYSNGYKDYWLVIVLTLFFGVTFGSMVISESDKGTLRHNKIAKAWRAKFDQVMIKARSLRGDAEFTQQLDYYENLLKKK